MDINEQIVFFTFAICTILLVVLVRTSDLAQQDLNDKVSLNEIRIQEMRDKHQEAMDRLEQFNIDFSKRVAALEDGIQNSEKTIAKIEENLTSLSSQRVLLTEQELELFCELIMAEFGGTSLRAQRKGASVVINRILHSDFPNTLEEVIYQKNQFSVTFDGSWGRWEVTESVRTAVQDALFRDYSQNSLFFLNVDLAIAQGYSNNAYNMLDNYEYVTEIDNVTFLR